MLKTNSKQAVKNLHAYIIENAQGYADERSEWDGRKNPEGFEEVALEIWGAFKEEYLNEHNLRFYRTIQNTFKEWGAGLAFGGLFDFYLHSAVEDLGEILEETKEEREQFSEDEAEQMLASLIYREVAKVAEKKGVFGYGA